MVMRINGKAIIYKVVLTLLMLCFVYYGFCFEDIDQDRMDDTWEEQYNLDLSIDDSDANPDGDSLTNLEEFFAKTDPGSFNASLSDSELINLIQGTAALFFIEKGKGPYGLFPDHIDLAGIQPDSDYYSIAGIGFGLMALAIADDNDWIAHADAYNRIETILERFHELQGEPD